MEAQHRAQGEACVPLPPMQMLFEARDRGDGEFARVALHELARHDPRAAPRGCRGATGVAAGASGATGDLIRSEMTRPFAPC